MQFSYRPLLVCVSFILLIAVLSQEVRAQDTNLSPHGSPIVTTFNQSETPTTSRTSRWFGVTVVAMVVLGIGIWYLWSKSNKSSGGDII